MANRHTTKSGIVPMVLFLLFMFLFCLLNANFLVSAQLPLTQFDIDSINKKQNYRDSRDKAASTSTCSTANTSNITSVYMIGDSITEGSKPQLADAFNSVGISSEINGLSSRKLSTGDSDLDGISVLEQSGDDMSGKDVIIVALGTNGGITESNIIDTIDKIKSVNNSATIYWVNIGVEPSLRSGSVIQNDILNQTLFATSTDRYTVIDWSTVVNANKEIGIIVNDGLGVHPNTRGKELFAQEILTNIVGGSSGTSCGLSALVGDDNPAKVWDFMVNKKGLQPYQAAGFMGNMQAEAGFEPRRTEYAWSDEPYLSDTVPPCANDKCQPGYGIVQWTAASRKDGLRIFSEEKGVIAGDLSLQLEYVWVEITGGCCGLKSSFRDKYGDVTVLDALLQTQTVEEATDLILRNYEIPADMDVAYQKRIGFANAWLAAFGSGGTR